jgi:hypothetical protein
MASSSQPLDTLFNNALPMRTDNTPNQQFIVPPSKEGYLIQVFGNNSSYRILSAQGVNPEIMRLGVDGTDNTLRPIPISTNPFRPPQNTSISIQHHPPTMPLTPVHSLSPASSDTEDGDDVFLESIREELDIPLPPPQPVESMDSAMVSTVNNINKAFLNGCITPGCITASNAPTTGGPMWSGDLRLTQTPQVRLEHIVQQLNRPPSPFLLPLPSTIDLSAIAPSSTDTPRSSVKPDTPSTSGQRPRPPSPSTSHQSGSDKHHKSSHKRKRHSKDKDHKYIEF